ncbi:MAG: biopolymer transport protein ExbD [Parvicellaceae bacterium]|jgi:biopolymer transport protein ExbD
MKKLKRKSIRKVTGISTTSLPDIVFILLFFFMAVAVMKTSDPLVEYEVPSSENLYRFEDQSLLANIRVGKDFKTNRTIIQLGDAICTIEEIPAYLKNAGPSTSENGSKQILAYLEIDKEIKMGIVNRIKKQLVTMEIYDIVLSGTEK